MKITACVSINTIKNKHIRLRKFMVKKIFGRTKKTWKFKNIVDSIFKCTKC